MMFEIDEKKIRSGMMNSCRFFAYPMAILSYSVMVVVQPSPKKGVTDKVNCVCSGALLLILRSMLNSAHKYFVRVRHQRALISFRPGRISNCSKRQRKRLPILLNAKS